MSHAVLTPARQEPFVNHAVELQAIGRVHRIGQTQATSVL